MITHERIGPIDSAGAPVELAGLLRTGESDRDGAELHVPDAQVRHDTREWMAR